MKQKEEINELKRKQKKGLNNYINYFINEVMEGINKY